MYFPPEFSIKDLDRYLTKSEVLDLLHIVDTSPNCGDAEDVKNLVLDLQKLVFFDVFLYISSTTNGESIYSLDIDFPQAYKERWFEKEYYQIDPIIAALMSGSRIVNWQDIARQYAQRPEGIISQEAREFGLIDGFTYGSIEGKRLTSLWLGGRYMERGNRSKAIFEFAMRSLIHPLKPIELENSKSTRPNILSKKEKEVLRWLKKGKSSWDIAAIMLISERTVNFHVGNIITKLDALNRTHAVAIAVAEKLIEV